ncbi:hypothetical protein GCM10009662_23630 [Catellatospora coxensis]|uniref:Uncharacterized protein n=2 Tax=Catellatospora coxensis TaxID=310354 RepID=A0A8J3KXY7_9ACTN|nr:hypothetical protein Cco03nite_41540 [Catellatospora coxensis]
MIIRVDLGETPELFVVRRLLAAIDNIYEVALLARAATQPGLLPRHTDNPDGYEEAANSISRAAPMRTVSLKLNSPLEIALTHAAKMEWYVYSVGALALLGQILTLIERWRRNQHEHRSREQDWRSREQDLDDRALTLAARKHASDLMISKVFDAVALRTLSAADLTAVAGSFAEVMRWRTTAVEPVEPAPANHPDAAAIELIRQALAEDAKNGAPDQERDQALQRDR